MMRLKLAMNCPTPVLSSAVTPERSKITVRLPSRMSSSTRVEMRSGPEPSMSLPESATTSVWGPACSCRISIYARAISLPRLRLVCEFDKCFRHGTGGGRLQIHAHLEFAFEPARFLHLQPQVDDGPEQGGFGGGTAG